MFVVKSRFYDICAVFVVSVFMNFGVYAAGLSGTVSVHETSETAASAKANAMNNARRKIITNILSKYSDKDALSELIKNTSDDDLTNLVLSSSVSNEQMSTTDYSASITMNLDNDGAKQWLETSGVRNWVPLAESGEKFMVIIVVQNGIDDWAELKKIARDDNIEIETQSITGNQIVAKLPLSYRTRFTAAVRGNGWQYSDNAGVLQIWK